MGRRSSRPAQLAAVLLELEQVGVEAHVEQHRHIKIMFTAGGEQHLYVIPKTTSDRRCVANSRAGVRRILRRVGMI